MVPLSWKHHVLLLLCSLGTASCFTVCHNLVRPAASSVTKLLSQQEPSSDAAVPLEPPICQHKVDMGLKAAWNVCEMLLDSKDRKLHPHGVKLQTRLEFRRVPVTIQMFGDAMNLLAESQFDIQGPVQAQEIFQTLKDLYALGYDHLRPNEVIYNTCIKACGKTGTVEGAKRAEELLEEMKREGIEPSIRGYQGVMRAWSATGSPESGERAQYWMDEIKKHGWKPNAFTYAPLIHSWTMSLEGEAAAKKASDLIEELTKLQKEENDPSLSPTTTLYNLLILAMMKGEEVDIGVRAEGVLKKMWHQHYTSGVATCKPTPVTYGHVMQAWIKSGHADRMKNIERLLLEIWKRYDDGDRSLAPGCFCYSSMIRALIKNGGENAGEKAEAVLRTMWERFSKGRKSDLRIRPDSSVYGDVLEAWAVSNHPQAGENAMRILKEMRRKPGGEKDPNVKPRTTRICYNAVLDAWSKSHSPMAANHAQHLLCDMWDIYYRTDKETRNKPNHYSYRRVLAALAVSPDEDAPDRAERLVQEMWELYERGENKFTPSTLCYNYVLEAWSNSNHPDAGFRIDAVLDDMKELSEDETLENAICPNINSYTHVIKAHEKLGNGQRVKDLMAEQLKLTEQPELEP